MAREVMVTIETTSAGITVDPGDTRVVRLYRDGDPVPATNGLPSGGTTGQVLAKASNADYDADWVTGGGGAAVWGGITGTLSDQTDLQAELDAKEASGTAAAAIAAHVAAVDPHGDRAYTDSAIATKLDDLSVGTADTIVTASADGTLLSRAAYTIATLLAAARDRATHTGTQLAATISDFAAAALSAVTWSTLTGKPSTFEPTAHAASHQSGGSDPIKLDDLAAPDDNTDLDATTSAHGLLPKLGGGSTNFLRADGTWAAPPTGGLSYFTESQNTSAPNATVYVNGLAATGAATSIDVAITPKGAGAFTLQVADSTTTGGDKRGANAIDLQTSRTNANQVASGAGAFVAGVDSRAAGQYSVAIGYSCYASQANGSIAIGYDCDAIGQYGSVAIGYQCGATGTASVALGVQNIASGENSFATGSRATTRSIYGARAHSSGRRTADGDRQQIYHVVSATTSSTSATTLTSNAGAASATNVMVLPNNSGAHFVARVTAYRSGGGVGSWEVCGTIERAANSASTALVGSTTIRTFGVSASLGSPVVDVVADTTRGAAVVQVTAGNTDTVYWVAKIELIQAA